MTNHTFLGGMGLGILAGAADDDFEENVVREVADNVTRLRHHRQQKRPPTAVFFAAIAQ